MTGFQECERRKRKQSGSRARYYFLPVVVLGPFLGPAGGAQPITDEPTNATSTNTTRDQRTDIAELLQQ
jgi:hypothetical protein